MLAWSPLPRSVAAALRDSIHLKASVRSSAIPDLVRWAATAERAACVQRLIQLVEVDPDIEVRASAALALADAAAVEALPVLIAAAEHGSPRLRQMALVAVGELAAPGQAEALGVVRRALANPAPAIRFQALVAAHRLFDSGELVLVLVPALRDEDARSRYVACRIVEERFLSEAAPPPDELLELLAERLEDAAPEVALAAAIPLARRGSEPARALIVRSLNASRRSFEPDDEQAAIEVCAELGLSAAYPGLRARAFGGFFGASPLSFQARVALARMGDERAREQILRDLSSRRRSVRDRAIAAAGQARLQAARPRLVELAKLERGVDQGSVLEALAALNR